MRETNVCYMRGSNGLLFLLRHRGALLLRDLALEGLPEDLGADLEVGHVPFLVEDIERLEVVDLRKRNTHIAKELIRQESRRTCGLNPSYMFCEKTCIETKADRTHGSRILNRALWIYQQPLNRRVRRLEPLVLLLIRVLHYVLRQLQ